MRISLNYDLHSRKRFLIILIGRKICFQQKCHQLMRRA